jgi:hypothetical protein
MKNFFIYLGELGEKGTEKKALKIVILKINIKNMIYYK